MLYSLDNITLMPHQIEAVKKSLTVKNFAFFMGAGTGKTFTALVSLINGCRKGDRVLILCPKSVIKEWELSLEYLPKKFREGLTIRVEGLEKFRAKKEPGRKRVRKEFLLDEYACDILIIDEVHKVKNEGSQAFKKVRMLEPRRKLFLTGTPNEHDNIFNYVVIGTLLNDMFGNVFSFKNKRFTLSEYGDILYPNPGTKELVTSTWNRYSYKLATLELGVSITHKITKLTPRDNKELDLLVNNWRYIAADGSKCVSHNIALRQFKEHQMTQGWYKDDLKNIIEIGSTKLKYADKLLRTISSPIIFFINYTHDATRLAALCDRRGVKYLRLDGTTNNTSAYITKVKAFKGHRVLIVNYLSGGVGLNLMLAHHLVLYSLPWSYINYEQSIKRIFRIGQKQDCIIHVPMIKNSIDEKIFKILQKKEKFNMEVINGK